MDTASGLTILGGAVGSAKLVEKLLGPTADYIGSGVKTWTERRVNNIGRIFRVAAEKLGPSIEDGGSVPPKVLKGILAEGSYCDDELAASYFGGVLASSRTSNARDDRGSTYIAQIARLSTYQIRAHYCVYHMFRNLFAFAENVDLASIHGQQRLEIIVPLSVFTKAMDFDATEEPLTLLPHVFSGLQRESLVSDPLGLGTGKTFISPDGRHLAEFTKKWTVNDNMVWATRMREGFSVPELYQRPAAEPHVATKRDELARSAEEQTLSQLVLLVQPTAPGIELFLWAHGMSMKSIPTFFHLWFELQPGILLEPKYHKSLRFP
jgi:hypothetical protein